LDERLKKYLAIESHEILNEFSVGIIICNNLYEVLFINKAFIDLCQLYGLSVQDSSNLKNLFEIEFFNEESIKKEISLLHKGLPFESEISSSDFSKRGLIKLIVKATPLMENGIFSGAIFIIEDLRVAIETTTEYIKRNADLQKVIEQTSDFFIIIDKEFSINQYSVNVPPIIKTIIDSNQNPALSDIIFADDLKIVTYYLNYSKLQKKYSHFIVRTINQIEYYCRIIPLTNKVSEVTSYYLFFDKTDSKTFAFKTSAIGSLDYYELLNKLDIKFIVYDSEFNIIQLSENLKEQNDLTKSTESKENILTKFDFINKEVIEKAEIQLDRNLTYKTEIQFNDKNRKNKIYELKFFVTDKNERVLFINDLTESYQNERKLKNKVLALESTINNSLQMVILMKSGGEIVFVNNAFCDNLGYDKKDLTSRSFYNLIDPKYLEKNIFDLAAFTQKKSGNLELPFINSKGEKVTLLTYFNPVKTAEGTLIFIACYLNELEKLKAKESEIQFYNKILQNTVDGIALVENSRFIKVNSSFLKIFGFESEAELVGRYFLNIICDDDTIRVSEFIRLIELKKQSPGKIDFVGRRNDNSRISIEMSVGFLEIDSRIVLILSVRDITEKIRAHREIRESEEKYRTVTENLDDCLFSFEKVGFAFKPVFCTHAIRKITGYSESDFLSDSKFFFRIAFPDDFKKVKPKLIDILESKSKKYGELEFRIINKESNLIWVRLKLNLQRSLSGSVNKIFGIMSDITLSKRREEELIKSTEELIRLNETKDKFISIVSHDLRTPFTSILGFTDLLQNDDSLSESEKKQYIKFIRESAQTMLSLVNSVLDWTRLQTGRIKFEPEKTNVSEIIKKAVSSLSGVAIQKSINILNLVNDDVYLFVDKNLIAQVFYNLISNAIKFTMENGRIEISCSPNSTYTYYNFSVKDNGIGIKPEDLNKLFSVDSKFTTEGTSGEKGSGLGLSLVKEIIEKHNGKIWVESQYRKGSNFQFSLPSSSAIILLVEPDTSDRMLYSKLIKNFKPDYNIYSESFGSEGLQKIKQYNPALIIANHSLPDMSGLDFIRKILKLNLQRKLQIIIIGSKLDRAFIRDYNELGVEFILSKPVNVKTLQQAIDKSLIKSFQKTRI
jgi:PAS domain S-box-containing protein